MTSRDSELWFRCHSALATCRLAGALVLAAALASAGTAGAVTIGFESLVCCPSSISESGFILTTDYQFLVGGGNPGSAMFPGATIATNTLRSATNSLFGLYSIDLSELNEHVGAQTIEFTGATMGGGTVSQIFTTDGPYGYQTFTFGPAFQNLTSVSWDQLNPESFLIYDNIVVQEMPVSAAPLTWGRVKSLYTR